MNSESLLRFVDANASKRAGLRRSHFEWDDEWLYGLCPEVVEHYRHAPFFAASPQTRKLIALSTLARSWSICLQPSHFGRSDTDVPVAATAAERVAEVSRGSGETLRGGFDGALVRMCRNLVLA